MKTRSIFILLFLSLINGHANAVNEEQSAFESTVQAVVRNKLYYKSGLEITPIIGTMPYDSVINHYGFGSRLTWHFSDHFGWEILDGQFFTSSLTNFTKATVNEWGVSNLQVPKIKYLIGTNFILSPLYGKLRVLGKAVVHYDIYMALGLGMANTEIIKLSSQQRLTDGRESIVKTGFDPYFDVALGFKVFITKFLGVTFEARDYVISSTLYGSKSLKSHFAVYGGLSILL